MDYWGDLTVPIALFVYSLSFCFICFCVFLFTLEFVEGFCFTSFCFLFRPYRMFWGTRGARTVQF